MVDTGPHGLVEKVGTAVELEADMAQGPGWVCWRFGGRAAVLELGQEQAQEGA